VTFHRDNPSFYACQLVRVVDGDTFVVNVDLGFEVHVTMTVRLAHVNAPELNTFAGRQAKTLVAGWFGDVNQVHTLFSYATKDKYGRRICDVEHAAEDLGLLSEFLLLNGLAVPYRAAVADPDV
jgi:endonuclease YncB( thermonuclease family)